jgi:hypothetical protein
MIDEYQFENNAKGQLASGINDSVTTLNVKAGEGAEFPALTGSKYFMCTLIDGSGNREIIKVTARTVDSFDTIVRAQEGTAARAFSADDKVELRVTKGFLNAVVSEMIAPDLDGTELILDADGDTSVTADTDDQIDIKIGGTDQISLKDGVIEPVTDNDIDLGASAKQIKDIYLEGDFVHNGITKDVQVRNPSAAASVAFTVATGGAYRIKFVLSNAGGDELWLRFNSDSGATAYKWAIHSIDQGANEGMFADSSDSQINLRMDEVNDDSIGEIFFAYKVGDNTITLVQYHVVTIGGTVTMGGGEYDGASDVISVQIFPQTGTLTGTVICERFF